MTSVGKSGAIRESNEASVYVRQITHKTMYEKAPFHLACELRPIKIHFSDHEKFN